ncbi:astacin [Necator americanus]|uniref:Zinc metalloproteinase n=1 Tax=Necator americanus TaxID=51031 RepID=W2TMA6_NECAM|nr:astacin [Necator americanus]ETN83245.1 astacin [Necator americanus]
MKIALVVLLLVAYANSADIFRTEFGAKIKAEADKSKTKLNISSLLQVRGKFLKLRQQIKESLALTPERKELLHKLMQKLVHIKKDHVHKSGDSIDEINKKVGMSDLLYDGDMVLTKEQAEEMVSDIDGSGSNRAKRQAYRNKLYPKTLWTDGVIYYFHPSASLYISLRLTSDRNSSKRSNRYRLANSMRSVFLKAAKEWSSQTCIDFHEDVVGMGPNRIKVFKEKGCWSMVGRLPRPQELSLGRGCDTIATAQHEIGHALGFFHQQARHDRDDYIVFNSENVVPRYLDQFKKQSKETNDNYGLTYDYGSTMQYGSTSGSQNGKPTMVPKDPKYIETLGSPFIAFYDLLAINTHYKCLGLFERNRCSVIVRRRLRACIPEKCDNNGAQCKMGGFPNPRDCSKCICPSGYGGATCDQKPEGCGEVLEATKEAKTLKSEIGDKSAGDEDREDMTKCYYWIKAPEGSKVEVKIVNLAKGLAIDGCRYWGVEIKTQEDQRASGYRFCAPEDAGVTLESHSNIVPIIAFNRHGSTEFELQYRIGTIILRDQRFS